MSEPVPQNHPTRIEALQAGVAPAFALLAGQQLGLFTVLGDEAMTADEVARRLAVRRDRIERLLYALVVAGLLDCDEGRFRNGAEAAAFLVAGRPGYLGGDHELLAELWHADLQTAASIRQGRPTAAHDFSQVDDAATAAFLRGLAPGALRFGRELARRYDFAALRSVLDVGGGPGTALLGLRERHPHLGLTLLELPRVLPVAEAILSEQGAPGSVSLEAGDIVKAPAAGRHDALLLKAMIQVLPTEQAAAALRNAHDSLTPGGLIFISGVGILNDDRLSPPAAVYYNLTFMNLYAGGASYTLGQHRAWLTDAGFADMQCIVLDSGSPLITARREA